ncbi:MAG: translation initiation factor IF-2 subunit alpha [Methanosarcinales archaeon]|nr:translation initiation factor IF-2 subunit alpha [ANME-2 cluster archaeon]MDF1531939.1 translation initiation factor IF-2 subunit alpha [ANME-2 cluster archaeon]MDW7776437.1 translation initiation factor IF-2 subunit alpha [Methanosarcinales archaeon]
MERKGWPEPDELVVCSVMQVKDFGAFTQLDEYGQKEGLIHISEVASGWVKYIRDHVREGQKIVCKVVNVDPERQHIDLSLKDVNEHQRRQKIQDWKNEQKAEKWIQYVAEVNNINPEDLEKLVDLLYDAFDSVWDAFDEAMRDGPEPLIEAGVDEKYARTISKIGTDNIKIPHVEISGYVDLTCPLPDGVDVINKSLLAAAKIKTPQDVTVDVSYVGAPRYRIHVIAPDYKKAESVLKSSADAAITIVKKSKGTGLFNRHNEAKA